MSQPAAGPDSPFVSVVVITMNRREVLAPCLESLRAQDYPHREIIVVDNASTDDTVEYMKATYPDVRLVALPTNEGVSGGRNRGAEAARGEICVFIDDDAWFVEKDAVRKTVEHFARDPSLVCVSYRIESPGGGVEEAKSIPRRDKKSLTEDYPCTYFCGAGFAVRRALFLDAGGFWPPLVYGSQELDLAYRWLDQGFSLWHASGIRVIHASVPSARPFGQWVYFNTRDRSWVAIRNLPWRHVVTTTILWWANTLVMAARRREWGPWGRGFRDALKGWPAAWRDRRPIGALAQKRLAAFSGRLWY